MKVIELTSGLVVIALIIVGIMTMLGFMQATGAQVPKISLETGKDTVAYEQAQLDMADYNSMVSVSAHAQEKHTMWTEPVSKCLDQKGPLFTFHRNVDQRNVDLCWLDGYNVYGIHVTEENGNPVTTFAKEKMKRLSQVLRYLKNSGYDVGEDLINTYISAGN